jgi:4-amino-4-deoxy-L-arabinose transferase-like glycosyltransferase
MIDRTDTEDRASVWLVAMAGVALLFVVVAVRFAAQQSVWTDESTQLSGLSLGLADQLRWLVGRLPKLFAVPPDRMPPLSYWLGSAWIRAFGDTVLTARCLSVTLSVASLFALWAAARLYLNRRTALICVTLLAFSPNFIVEAAEIRAYAAFIFFSALLVYCYLRLLSARPNPSALDLWMFSLAAALCSYTHFFGILISAGAFSCLLAFYLPHYPRPEGLRIVHKAKWPLLFYVMALSGLMPFVFAAVRNSSGGDMRTAAVTLPFSVRIHGVIKVTYRLFSHQSMLGIPGLSAAALLAGLLLMIFGTTPGSDQRGRQLLLFVFVNFILVALVGASTSAFSAFSPTYNVWALPVVALLSGTALIHQSRYIRALSGLCVTLLIAADCYAALRLSTAGELYGHTRTNVVKDAIDEAGAKDVIVLYANDAPAIYFAMLYFYNGGLRQYFAEGETVHLIGSPVGSSSPWICDQNAGTLLVARDQELPAELLQFHLSHPGVHTQAYHALEEYLEIHRGLLAPKWELISQHEYLAQSALALAVYKKRAADVSRDSSDCNAP